MAALVDQWTHGLDRIPEHDVEIDDLLLQVNPPAEHARDLEQIADEACEITDLSFDDSVGVMLDGAPVRTNLLEHLDGGVDGLDPHRKILLHAHEWLAPGARVLLEVAFDQEEAAMWIAKQFEQYDQATVLRDLGKRPRVLSVRRV